MKRTLIAFLALVLTACRPDCDYDQLYNDGHAAGVLCEDWAELWTEGDGECAADALADGYNAARAESGEDCDQSPPIVVGPRDFIAPTSH